MVGDIKAGWLVKVMGWKFFSLLLGLLFVNFMGNASFAASCPAGTTLVDLATPRNATTASSTGNVTGIINNGLGALLPVGTNAAGSDEPRLQQGPGATTLTLGFPDLVPMNAVITISLARDNPPGELDIQDSDDNVAYSGALSFSGTNPTDDIIEHLAYNVASVNGAQFVRFTLTGGRFRVDGVEYSQICEPNPVVDLSITKDDGSATYTPGGTASYTIVVTNNGPDDVAGATIEDDLPDGITLTGPWTCTPSSANSICNTTPNTTDPISINVDIVNGDFITVTLPVQFSADMGDY